MTGVQTCALPICLTSIALQSLSHTCAHPMENITRTMIPVSPHYCHKEHRWRMGLFLFADTFNSRAEMGICNKNCVWERARVGEKQEIVFYFKLKGTAADLGRWRCQEKKISQICNRHMDYAEATGLIGPVFSSSMVSLAVCLPAERERKDEPQCITSPWCQGGAEHTVSVQRTELLYKYIITYWM